jgi:UDP-N-acetylglucosamine 2-epimerase
MAPVIKELRKHPDEFICRVCVTAHKKVKEEVKREGKVFKLRT